MKKILLICLVSLWSSSAICAQDWYTNAEKALETAVKEQKNVILVFQGSDWCAPCIKLDREVWSTPQFQEAAKAHFIMLQADFPKKKRNRLTQELQIQNNRLAEKYNPRGHFPYVVVLDPQGTILGSLGYEKTTPALYFKKLMEIQN